MRLLPHEPRRRALILAGLACAWGLALVVAALTAPVYGSQTLVGILSIGVLVTPVFFLLVAAASTAPRTSPGSPP